ncbi:hypothetical protein DUI87_18171 [Hirundo rustica rustica]|uniref:Uncharacterized protein n=1 Tax=Hirundo rustica rustica TaxID=333673 RepID=A0A3M0JXV6_HIRRU|nr:hypothetical protein DUI87_18171 [Hirundo rustica rustica]
MKRQALSEESKHIFQSPFCCDQLLNPPLSSSSCLQQEKHESVVSTGFGKVDLGLVFLEQSRQNSGRLLALLPSYSSESLNLDIVCSCGLISIQVEDAHDHYHGHDFKHDQAFPASVSQSHRIILQLGAISSDGVICYLGEETFQEVVESDKVCPELPFIQAKHPQLPQPLFTGLILQTLHHLPFPSLNSLLYVFSVVRGPKVNPVFEVEDEHFVPNFRVQGIMVFEKNIADVLDEV